MDAHSKMVHEITRANRAPGQTASGLGIMLQALHRAEADPRGLFEGLCENFCGRLAHRMLRAAGFEVTEATSRRIR